MSKFKTTRAYLRMVLLASVAAAAFPVWAEGIATLASIPPEQLQYGANFREQMRSLPSDQRDQLREDRRQRREIFEQLSAEERFQIRRDVRMTADVLAPRRLPRGFWG